MNKRNIEDIYPLSPMQQGMLFHSVFAPESGTYFEQTEWTLLGELDLRAFERAWKAAVARHSALRTAFVWEGVEEFLQIVLRSVDLPMVTEDWRVLPEEERSERLREFLLADRSRGFVLDEAPLMRLAVFRTGEEEHHLVWSHHHLLLDGWSVPILLGEVFTLYEGYRSGREVPLPPAAPFREYVSWLQRQDRAAAELFWRGILQGFSEPTSLMLLPPPERGGGYRRITSALPADLSSALRGLAREQITLNTVMQGAWALLLSRYSGQDDVLFGATVSGRPAELEGSERMVGLFINTLPVRTAVPGALAVSAWLRELQQMNAGMRQFEFTPLVSIHGWSDVPRETPLFETLLVFENYPSDEKLQGLNGRMTVTEGESFTRTNFPLTLAVSPGREIGLEIAFDADRFDHRAVERMAGHLRMVLEAFAENLEMPLGSISLLDPEEERLVLDTLSGVSGATADLDIPAHQLVEDQSRSTPDALAVIIGERRLTYATLEADANRLAHYIASAGVSTVSIVGICLERSPELITAMIGVLKAGGAYLPMDPGTPSERLRAMVQDAGVNVVLTQEALRSRFEGFEGTIVCLDSARQKIAREDSTPLAIPVSGDQLAYVIYTSGSTGKPKGVAVPHRGLVNHTRVMKTRCALSTADRVLQFLSPGFDAAAEEIYPTLASGAALVMHPAPAQLSGRELMAFCAANGVTVLHLPVAYWHECVRELSSNGSPEAAHIRVLVVGGESPQAEKLALWMRTAGSGGMFVNAYGPTETTITATMLLLEGEGRIPSERMTTIPIGRPIPGATAYVLGDDLRPVPIGVPGRLFIGGVGVSRGYIHRPDATAEKFLPDPFGRTAGGRLYDTGDRARYLLDGTLEFLGRVDHQVKVRGYRIELGEIESRLREHPSVSDAVALVRGDGATDKRIVAYVTTSPGTSPDTAVLLAHVRASLPDYMIPSAVIVLEKFPLSPNGKVNRRALPAPSYELLESGRELVPLRTATEEIVAGLWSSVLGVQRIGAADSFFGLGGHSLLATQLLSRIRDTFGIDLPLRVVFEHPTLAALARSIDAATAGGKRAPAPPLLPVPRDQELPLSFSQQRLWFIDQLAPGGSFYNIGSAFRLHGSLDVEAMTQALREMVRRHEILRTTFSSVGGTPVQVIGPADTWGPVVRDLAGIGEDEREGTMQAAVREEFARPFDLEAGPLVRANLIRLSDADHVLVVVVHHIVADGWSVGVMVEELLALYQAFHDGRLSPLPDLAVQYADFASWQRSWLQGDVLEEQLQYWRRKLAGIPPVLEMPTDAVRPAVQTFRGGRTTLSLPGELTTAIRDLCRDEGVTPFMVLLAAYQAFLSRYSGQEDIVVGSPIAGRRHSEVERLVGFFVNNLILRTTFTPDDTFRTVLAKVRETALEAYAHQDIPFEKLVEELHPQRDLSHAPLFQVMFVLQNIPVRSTALPGLRVERVEAESTTANFDLTLIVQEGAETLHAELEYNAELFADATATRMLNHFATVLGSLVRHPDDRVTAARMLSGTELTQLLKEWNATAAPYPSDRCVQQVFERLVDTDADAPAVSYLASARAEEQPVTLSYQEVNRKANQLALHLRTLGVGPEVLVGICMDRSVEMVIGILGVLKAGGAFLPLDPTYPQERLAFMIEDSGLAVLLTQAFLQEILPVTSARIVCLDREWTAIETEQDANLPLSTVPDSLAYVIYTSGSTGRPKGAMLSHRGLCNLATVHRNAFGVGRGSRILQFSSLSFDASVWEFVMALLNGATLCLTSHETIASAHDLPDLMHRQQITTVTIPPSILSLVPPVPLDDLQTVITAGEQCPAELVARWAPGRRFFNAYGPTETTVCASMYLCDPADASNPPIGRPIGNFELYILDGNLQPVPVGVPGELHIGGVALARGYLRRPDTTAERFVPHPFSSSPGARLYKSGDLCRYRPDGNVEFLGRVDFQVKVRGFRIELGEIESGLREYPGVRDVAVVVREDVPGDKRLVAYLVVDGVSEPTVQELRNFLRTRVPEYMVPSAFVVLEAMPLTPSGKVDRKELPIPDRSRPGLQTEYIAPRNEVEQTLAELTAALLSVERVGVYDNFFDLGGHSLLATQFISRARDAFQVDIPLRLLFEKPLIADIALEIERIKAGGGQTQAPKIKAVSREGARMKRSELSGQQST